MGFDLSNYEEVKDRIPKFWKEHPKGSIRTSRLDSQPGEWVVLASLYREGESEPFATGLAHEIAALKGVNATSALENCETSAIGRALANGGYATGKQRPSREEMQKVERGPKSAATGVSGAKADPYAAHKQAGLRAVVAAYPGVSDGEAKRLAAKHFVEAVDTAGPEAGPDAVAGVLLLLVGGDEERPF
jgi:hypothetical protein